MAIGDNKVAVNFVRKSLNGDYSPSRTYKYALSSTAFASISANTVASIGAVAGVLPSAGDYVNGTTITGVTLASVSNVVTFDSHNIEIAADAANPSTARTLIVYADAAVNGTQVASTDVVAVIDLTTDVTTPISLVNGMTLNINASGVYTVTVNA
jgi:hypothetical protein